MSEPVRIPADVERPDVVIAGLNLRQTVIVAAGIVVAYLTFVLGRGLVPWPLIGVLVMVEVAMGGVLALGRRDGVSADRLLLAGWRWWRSPRTRVLAPEGLPAPPRWPAAAPSAGSVGVLELPVDTVTAEGVLVGPDQSVAVVCEASTVNFALRAPHEQRWLVAVFGRWLNSLTIPVQILLRTRWVDLEPMIAAVQDMQPFLPHPALQQTAVDHLELLAALADSNQVRQRAVYLVFTDPHPGRDPQAAVSRLRHQADTAARALVVADITVTVLDGSRLTALLAACVNPLAPPRAQEGWAAPDQLITGGTP